MQQSPYGYDPNGNIISKVTPGGIVDLKIWDANDAMTSAGTGVYGGQVYAHWDYTRNLDSQVASSTRGSATPVGTDQQYGYDLNTQLTDVSDATIPTNSVGFTYDPARHPTTIGERTQTFTPSGETCWTALSSTVNPGATCGSGKPGGATTLTYDLNGNRTTTTDGTTTQTFTWNPNSQLSAVNTPGAPSQSGVYTYAADGLRVTKNVAGVNTVFAWDDTTNPAALIQDGNNYYIYGPDGLPTQRIGTSPTMFLHHDNYNTTRLTTDTLGALSSTQTFDAWGNQTNHTGTPPTLGWNSQYQDPETHNYYLRNRYYDPTTTQFTPDPLFAITGERYGYAGNDPINGSDPTGLCSWTSWKCDKQSVANVAGGVLNGITLGHAKGVLNHVPGAGSHNADKVNWDSKGSKTGQIIGAGLDVPIAYAAPEIFGGLSTLSTAYNAYECVENTCSAGEWLLLFADAGLSGAAGLYGNRLAAFVSLAIGQIKSRDKNGNIEFHLADARSCPAGSSQ